MKKDMMKRSLAGFFMGACIFAAPCAVEAQAPAPGDECAKEMLLSYFPAPIVKETLKKFNVPQDKWDGILKSLSNKDKEVVKLVEQKAAGMDPNPLKDPKQRPAAVKLFRDTLIQVFSDAMKDNNMMDASQYQTMLDDIQQQKAKKFAMCMEKQKQKAIELDKAASSTPSDEDMEDEDENDEDENDDDNDNDNDEENDDNDDDNDDSDEDDDMDDEDDNQPMNNTKGKTTPAPVKK